MSVYRTIGPLVSTLTCSIFNGQFRAKICLDENSPIHINNQSRNIDGLSLVRDKQRLTG